MATLRRRISSLLPFDQFDRSARLYLLAIVIDGIIFSAWQLFFNFYILSLGYQEDFLGLVNAMPSIATLVFGIPLGLLSDRIGRRKAMIFGVLTYTIGQGLQVLIFTRGALVGAAFLAGIGYTLYQISQAPFMMSVTNERNRTLLFSLSFGMITLAGAVGNILAGQLPNLFSMTTAAAPDSATVYRWILISSVLAGSFAIVPLLLIRETRRPHAHTSLLNTAALRILTRPVTLKIILVNLLTGTGAGLVIPYLNLYLKERYAISDAHLGIYFSVAALLTGVGSVFGPRLAHRLGSNIRTVVVTQALSILFLLMMALSPLAWVAVIGFLMRNTFMNMAYPLLNTFSMEQFATEEQGAASGTFNISWMAGWAAGQYVSGFVQVHFSFTPLFTAMTLLYCLAIYLTWAYFKGIETRAALLKSEVQVQPDGV